MGREQATAWRDWDYDGPEIVADGIVHGLGLVLAAGGSIVLLGFLVTWADLSATLAHAIYCTTLILTLSASAAYNLWPVSPLKWALRRLDHAMIFGLIAGTYTPFLTRVGTLDTSLLLVSIWTISIAGMVLKFLDIGQREWIATALYIALGWSGMLTLRSITGSMPPTSLALLFVGGVLYSGGAIFHHWRSLRFQNAIWHGFVLSGAVCHFVAVLLALHP